MRRRNNRSCVLMAALVVAGSMLRAGAGRGEEVKIGVIYDYTGPFPPAVLRPPRSARRSPSTDQERGGVEGYTIKAIYADAQSKAEVAINESIDCSTRREVNLIMVSTPVHTACRWRRKWTRPEVHVGQRLHCIELFKAEPAVRVSPASAIRPVRRCLVHACLKKQPDPVQQGSEDLKIAIIYEDGPYGSGVAAATRRRAKIRHAIVLKEGYTATAPDLSSLVTSCAARAPTSSCTPATTRTHAVWRQAREQGLKWAAADWHGAGYSHTTICARAWVKTPSTSPAWTASPRNCLTPRASPRGWTN